MLKLKIEKNYQETKGMSNCAGYFEKCLNSKHWYQEQQKLNMHPEKVFGGGYSLPVFF